jgi:hypothetical protein
MGSSATINLSNISISPCRLTFDGVDLGAVEGDVTVTLEQFNSPIKVAQLGNSDVDNVSNGMNLRIKARLLEVTPAQIKRLLPSAALIGSTGVYMYNNVGDKYSTYAKQLVLHPLSKNDADKSQDILFYKATVVSPGEIPFGNETIIGFEVEFVALPDFTTSPARFGFYGDPAIGVIAASAAAPVAGANTGNGTVTGVTVSNAATKTETITLTCVDEAVNGGEFHVTGSSPSRSLGVATVGVLFTADDSSIQFTINDGAVDFIESDSFTIATTAANYV